MLAAKREQIKITGAIIMELLAKDVKGRIHKQKKWYISAHVLTGFSFKKCLHKTYNNKS